MDRAHMNTIKQHALNPVESNLEDRPAVEIETFGTTPGDRGLGAERGTIVVSIGILAYNEESSIAGTIESILEQSIVKDPPPGWQVEIVCVPNGCTDLTAEVAGESLKAMSAGTDEPAVSRIARGGRGPQHPHAPPGKPRRFTAAHRQSAGGLWHGQR